MYNDYFITSLPTTKCPDCKDTGRVWTEYPDGDIDDDVCTYCLEKASKNDNDWSILCYNN